MWPSSTLRARLALNINPAEDRVVDGVFEDLAKTNKYDSIVMNPPFGVGGKTAMEHVAKAWAHLRDGGRLVALIPTGPAADKRLNEWLYGVNEKGLPTPRAIRSRMAQARRVTSRTPSSSMKLSSML